MYAIAFFSALIIHNPRLLLCATQAFDILKTALGPQHQDTINTLAMATLHLINSSTTRVQLSKAEKLCRLAVKCSFGGNNAFPQKKAKQVSGGNACD